MTTLAIAFDHPFSTDFFYQNGKHMSAILTNIFAQYTLLPNLLTYYLTT